MKHHDEETKRANVTENDEAKVHPGELSDPGRPPDSSVPDRDKRRIALCAMCELRDSCNKPVPPGGIWHCADFC